MVRLLQVPAEYPGPSRKVRVWLIATLAVGIVCASVGCALVLLSAVAMPSVPSFTP